MSNGLPTGIKTSPELLAALERAKGYVMSPAERHAQRRSWVRGQMGLSHPEMSRAEIEALVDQAIGPSALPCHAGEVER